MIVDEKPTNVLFRRRDVSV